MSSEDLVIPAFIRGALVEGDLTSFPGRGVQASFQAPDPMSLLDRLPLADPLRMRDLHDLLGDWLTAKCNNELPDSSCSFASAPAFSNVDTTDPNPCRTAD
jgi:hypothetical protein